MVNSLYDKNMTDKSEYLKEKYMLLGRKEEKARLPVANNYYRLIPFSVIIIIA